MKRNIVFFLFLLLIIFKLLGAAEIKFKGFVQPWLYYAQENSTNDDTFGFTLRRIRFNPYGSFSKKIQWLLSFGWDKQVAKIVDAYLEFQISKPFQIRIGQFTVPGTMSSSLTSSAKLDMVERPEITERWSENNGLSSFRSIGIQIHGSMFKEKLYYAFMIANPKTYGVFTPSLQDSEYINENNGIAYWGRIEASVVNGLKFGTFYGTSQENNDSIKRNTYGAHIFYVKKFINVKAEYISGKYETEGIETQYNGMYIVIGYTIKKLEPIFRFGTYSPNNGDADEFGVVKYQDYTLGLNYFQSENVKIQANYVFRDESMAAGIGEKIKNNIFYMNFQFSF